MKKAFTFLLLLIISLLYMACESIPTEVNQEWEEESFFVNAQEAADLEYYKIAMFYYQVYQIRYPENFRKNIAADYEQAFLQYKMKNYQLAEQLFNDILVEYQTSPYSFFFEERYKILTEMLLVKIEERKEKKNFFQNFGRKRRTGSEETSTES